MVFAKVFLPGAFSRPGKSSRIAGAVRSAVPIFLLIAFSARVAAQCQENGPLEIGTACIDRYVDPTPVQLLPSTPFRYVFDLADCVADDVPRALVLRVEDPAPAGHATGIYLRWGEEASRARFQFSSDSRDEAEPVLVVPEIQAEAHVALEDLLGADPGGYCVTLVAEVVPITVGATSISRVHCNQESFRMTVFGEGLDTATFHFEVPGDPTAQTCQIVNAQNRRISSRAVEVLVTCPAGVETNTPFDLVASLPGMPDVARLDQALIVDGECADCGALEVSLETFPTRLDRVGIIVVSYTNAGRQILPARLLRVGAEGLSPSLDPDLFHMLLNDHVPTDYYYPLLDPQAVVPAHAYRREPILIFTSGADGLPYLAPGESASVMIAYRYLEDTLASVPLGPLEVTFFVDEFIPTLSDGAVVFNELDDPPPHLISPLWSRVKNQVEKRLLNRWSNYAPLLSERAECLRSMAPTFSVGKLFESLARELDGAPALAIVGTVQDFVGTPVADRVVTAAANGVLEETRTDQLGAFAFQNLAPGSYVLEVPLSGGSPRTVQLDPGSCGASGVELDIPVAAATVGSVPPPPPPPPPALPPILPPMPPERLFTRRAEAIVALRRSEDPNEKDGPGVEGGPVGPGQLMGYSIHFENTGDADAISVDIEDELDPSNFDISSVELVAVVVGTWFYFDNPYCYYNCYTSWSTTCFTCSTGSPTAYEGIIHPIPPTQSGGSYLDCRYYLRVNANLVGSQLTWSFNTLDCGPGDCYQYYPYCSPSGGVGFLSAADSGPGSGGKASVFFRVNLSSGLEDESPVGNHATIRFDHGSFQEPCNTCRYWNCVNSSGCPVDLTPPTPPNLCPGGSCVGSPPLPLEKQVIAPPPASWERPQSGTIVSRSEGLFLAWQPIPRSVTSMVKVWPSIGGSQATATDYPTAHSAVCPDGLVPGTTYSWRVIADEISSGSPIDTPIWEFTLAGFIRGDGNGDRDVDIADAIAILQHLFLGMEFINCQDALDANDDGEPDISDPIYLLEALFLGGPPLPPPSGACGEDPTPDNLDCLESTCP